MSTASEVLLIFTTQLYLCFCNYNEIVFISSQGKAEIDLPNASVM